MCQPVDHRRMRSDQSRAELQAVRRPVGWHLTGWVCGGLVPAWEAVNPPIDTSDARWYQRAVFYEVLVRGFYDGNGDGTGDIRGLTERLDYLEWLGIDCIW